MPTQCVGAFQRLMNDLYLPPLRTPNGGSFQKGLTPWNKGRKGKCTRGNPHEFAKKGHQGFSCRPVLCLNPDGTIHSRFSSVSAAAKAVGARDRHTITHACQGKYRCRGYKWYYEDEYIPWADYHYNVRKGRDAYGRLLKGNTLRVGQQLSPEGLAKRRASASRRAIQLNNDPNSNFGRHHNACKPVRDITTDTDYPSIKSAAAATGISSHEISGSITRNGITHGHKFIKL